MGLSSQSNSKNAFAESSGYVQGAAWSAPDIIDYNTRGEAAMLKPKHVKTLLSASKAKKAGVLDDSSNIQENIIKLLTDLPADSRRRDELSHRVTDKYWDTLAHPTVATYGDLSKYRQADGSHNNLQYPDIGKAGAPYGRTGKPQGVQNVALPDPGDIFDLLFARNEKKEHPNKLSSLFFSVATVITHDFFSTVSSPLLCCAQL
jgi:linoleate 10R-lipoxygenase